MSGAPASGPKPCTTLNMPGGAPASWKAWCKRQKKVGTKSEKTENGEGDASKGESAKQGTIYRETRLGKAPRNLYQISSWCCNNSIRATNFLSLLSKRPEYDFHLMYVSSTYLGQHRRRRWRDFGRFGDKRVAAHDRRSH